MTRDAWEVANASRREELANLAITREHCMGVCEGSLLGASGFGGGTAACNGARWKRARLHRVGICDGDCKLFPHAGS